MLKRLLSIGTAVVAAVVTAVVAIPGSANASDATRIRNYVSAPNYPCLGVDGGDSKVADGALVITWTCDGSANQQWIIVPDATTQGTFNIQNSVAPTECLSVANGSLNAGARVILWHCKPASDNQDQRWYLPTDRGGVPYVFLQNYNSGLDAAASSTGSGSWLMQEPKVPAWAPRNEWLLN